MVGFWDGSGKWSKFEQILRLPGSRGYTMPELRDIVIPGHSLGLHCDITMIEREGKARRIFFWDACGIYLVHVFGKI